MTFFSKEDNKPKNVDQVDSHQPSTDPENGVVCVANVGFNVGVVNVGVVVVVDSC